MGAEEERQGRAARGWGGETSDRGLIGPLQQRVPGAWRTSPGLPHPVKRPSPFSLIFRLWARWALSGRGGEGS